MDGITYYEDGGNPIYLDGNVYLCARTDGDAQRFFSGSVAQVGFYNEALNASDIAVRLRFRIGHTVLTLLFLGSWWELISCVFFLLCCVLHADLEGSFGYTTGHKTGSTYMLYKTSMSEMAHTASPVHTFFITLLYTSI